MRIPKHLKFPSMEDALACAHGIVSNIPFWHADLISSGRMLQERMLALEDSARITESGAKALGWLNYLFKMYETDHALLLTHALAWLFLTPQKEERSGKHPCRIVAEGIIKFSGLTLKFSKGDRLTIDTAPSNIHHENR